MLVGNGLYSCFGKNSVDLVYIGSLENDVSILCLDRKAVHILDINALLVYDLEKLLKASNLVSDLYDRNVRQKGRKSIFGKLLFSCLRIAYDQTEKTKLCGVCKAERENVNIVFFKNVKNLAKSACSVFDKYCKLFCKHNSSS